MRESVGCRVLWIKAFLSVKTASRSRLASVRRHFGANLGDVASDIAPRKTRVVPTFCLYQA
jgi:hypothetical protein